jgi:MFS family permease
MPRPFRNRAFRLVWFGQAVSSLGNAMYRVTIAWTVYRVTGSTADMGLVLAANMIPQLLLTLLGGSLADRLPRRSVIMVCDLTAGLVTLGLTVASLRHSTTTPERVVASFALGVVTSFFGPAYSPIYRDVLPVEDQQAVSAIRSVTSSCTSIIGPMLAGLVFAFGSAAVGFGVDAATFAFSAVCTLLARVPGGRAKYSGAMGADIRAGLRMVLETGWLRVLILLSLLANLVCVAPLAVLLPAVVEQAHGGGSLLGVATAVQTASTALFAILAGKYAHRVPSGAAVFGLLAVSGLGIVLLGLGVGHPLLILPGLAVAGFGFSFNVIESALIQEHVPAGFLSRVYSVTLVTSFALAPVGYAAAGALARSVGSGAVLCWGGAILAAVCLAWGVCARWRLSGLTTASPQEVAAAPAADLSPAR